MLAIYNDSWSVYGYRFMIKSGRSLEIFVLIEEDIKKGNEEFLSKNYSRHNKDTYIYSKEASMNVLVFEANKKLLK